MYNILVLFFFFNDTATTEIYTLSLHDALPIFKVANYCTKSVKRSTQQLTHELEAALKEVNQEKLSSDADRKSTRLNSSHANISYAVFCLKKKKKNKKYYYCMSIITRNTELDSI